MGIIEKIFGTHSHNELKRIYPIVDRIEALAPAMEALSDEELKGKTKEFKDRLNEGETLETYGAVSEQTAKEMAEGAAKAAGAEAALSATGIAGPSGGTEDKPVGLVYIGCYLNGETVVKECRFHGNRMENRAQTVETALEMLKDALLKE